MSDEPKLNDLIIRLGRYASELSMTYSTPYGDPQWVVAYDGGFLSFEVTARELRGALLQAIAMLEAAAQPKDTRLIRPCSCGSLAIIFDASGAVRCSDCGTVRLERRAP